MPQFAPAAFAPLNKVCDATGPTFADKEALKKVVAATTAATTWSALLDLLHAQGLDADKDAFQRCLWQQFKTAYPIADIPVKDYAPQCGKFQVSFDDKRAQEAVARDVAASNDWDKLIDSLTRNAVKDDYFACLLAEAKRLYPVAQFTNPLYQRFNKQCTNSVPSYDTKLLLKQLVARTQGSTSFDDIYKVLADLKLDTSTDAYASCLVQLLRDAKAVP